MKMKIVCSQCHKPFIQTDSPARANKYCSFACVKKHKRIVSNGKIESRFFRDTRKTNGCWLWKRAIFKGVGYGLSWAWGKKIGAHRLSWIIHNGKIPNKLHVLHKCDNRLCVNPSHLFLGTHRDNIDDMVKKGRSLRGERHNNSKLKDDDIREIRRLYEVEKLSSPEIARRYKLNRSTPLDIINRRVWKHII